MIHAVTMLRICIHVSAEAAPFPPRSICHRPSPIGNAKLRKVGQAGLRSFSPLWGEAKPKKNRHGSKPPRPCKGGGTLVRRSRARRLAPRPGCFRPTCRALGGLSLAALALKHDIVNCGLHTSWPSATPWLTLCLRNGRAEVQRCMSSCTTATVTVQPPAAIESAPSPGNVVRI